MLAVVLSFAFPAVVLSSSTDLQDQQDVWIVHLGFCESGWRDVTILDSNDKYSHGYLQFQMGTWLSYGKPFGATAQNIHDPVLQMKVAQSMLDQGLESNWLTCSRYVTKKYGEYPTGMSDS